MSGDYIPQGHQAEQKDRWRHEDHNVPTEERMKRRKKREERYVPVNEKKASYKAQIDAHNERTRGYR